MFICAIHQSVALTMSSCYFLASAAAALSASISALVRHFLGISWAMTAWVGFVVHPEHRLVGSALSFPGRSMITSALLVAGG
jgi:hypothetical protein